MLNGRNLMLAVVCLGLLSTGAMGMPPDGKSTQTDPMNQTSSGMGSGSGVDGSGTSSGSGMGSQSGMGTDSDREKITGEILRVQDELYVVKDPTGKEISLHVDSSTQQSGKLKEGDRIEAEISSEGHAFKLKKAKDMN